MAEQGRGAVPALQCAGQQQQQQQQQQEEEALLVLLGSATGILVYATGHATGRGQSSQRHATRPADVPCVLCRVCYTHSNNTGP